MSVDEKLDGTNAVPLSEAIDDIDLACQLLRGFLHTDGNGRTTWEYLEAGSPLELAAREALCRLLASDDPLDSWVRFHLAQLFKPDVEHPSRELVFKHRRPGRSGFESEIAADSIGQAVAGFIIDHVRLHPERGMRESIYTDAMKRFGFKSRSQVLAIWKKYGPRKKYLLNPPKPKSPI